ncbi:MAG: hypothetical protein SFX19_09320 [Alphaproteobacteria bacterium]|nr:hypothetical protein [Alphaproteobacteria bacterium]
MDIANQKKYLYKVLGKDSVSGRDAWWVLRIKPEKLVIFSAIIDKGHLDMTKYGTVLESGFGTSIPPEVLKKHGFGS